MQRNHSETSLMIDERQPVQISGSISTSPQSAGRETLLFLLREGGAERAEYSRPLKMYRDILSGRTSPTSEGGTQTVWMMMDKCIFWHFSPFCEMIYLTAVRMRKTTSFRRRESGCGAHDSEEVCPVSTVIAMSYLIKVWTSWRETAQSIWGEG